MTVLLSTVPPEKKVRSAPLRSNPLPPLSKGVRVCYHLVHPNLLDPVLAQQMMELRQKLMVRREGITATTLRRWRPQYAGLGPGPGYGFRNRVCIAPLTLNLTLSLLVSGFCFLSGRLMRKDDGV